MRVYLGGSVFKIFGDADSKVVPAIKNESRHSANKVTFARDENSNNTQDLVLNVPLPEMDEVYSLETNDPISKEHSKTEINVDFLPTTDKEQNVPKLEKVNSFPKVKADSKSGSIFKLTFPDKKDKFVPQLEKNLDVRNDSMLPRSKSESCINCLHLPAATNTSPSRRYLNKDRGLDEEMTANVIEELIRLQNSNDPIMRKLYERNSRKYYKEKLCVANRLKTQQETNVTSVKRLAGSHKMVSKASAAPLRKVNSSMSSLNEIKEEPEVRDLTDEEPKNSNKQWIGVNGKEGHVHSFASSSNDVSSLQHIKPDDLPQTPHIIVSLDGGDEKTIFSYPDLSDSKNQENDQQQEPFQSNSENQGDPQENDVKVRPSATPTTDQGSCILDLDKKTEDIPSEGNEANGGRHLQRAPLRSQLSFRQSSEESLSSANSPVEERIPPTFAPSTSVEEPVQPEFTPRSTTLHPRTNKKRCDHISSSLTDLNAHCRSCSMLSLPQNERPYRKTRQGSMMSILQLYSSQLDVNNDSKPGRQPSKTSINLLSPNVHYRNLRNSTSMTSLDPNDPFLRKSRKSSKLGMMRRVSSQKSVESSPSNQFDAYTSKNSLSFVVPHLDWQVQMNDSLILCVSALYAKLIVVMGMAFPIAEIISDDVPLIFYNSFYLYLYFGSILFLIYAYLFLLRTKSISSNVFMNQVQSLKMRMPRLEVNWNEIPMPNSFRHMLPKKKEAESKSDREDKFSVSTSAYKPPKYTITETSNHGSMYLKMGAVLFGIGSMIYSGLEFGQYFELRSDTECANILMAISPVARMIFTFLQMYFIFLNSRVAISKHTTIARFGLMHMIGTNLCIWLNVLVQETKHEIAHLTHNADQHHADLYPGHSVESHEQDMHRSVLANNIPTHDSLAPHAVDSMINKSDDVHNVVRRSVSSPEDFNACRRINLMGNVVSSASPFLFPCTIEYSLLCAGVLYVMWKNINVNKVEKNTADGDSDISTFIARKVRHHYSVDCARASRGLFMGIFILVLTIISLILFYVLISNEQFKRFAILEANIIEVSIYSLAIISVIVGMKQMRELEFILEGDIELDNILLIIAQVGVYIYTSFTIIGGYFSLKESHTLPLLTAVMTLIQTTLQTLFILDGSRRCCYNADQLDRKPGREMVTFLLVCNLAMWAISTFETSRADVHPTQLQFYGIWAWTIISHVSMPLAIFYRFHVTVCLGEIWKRAYKLKNDFIAL